MTKKEQEPLLVTVSRTERPRPLRIPSTLKCIAVYLGIVATAFGAAYWVLHRHGERAAYVPKCVQPAARVPVSHPNSTVEVFKSKSVQKRLFEHLSQAVQVNTVSFDSDRNVPPKDPNNAFTKLHSVLEKLYPLVHSNLERHVINTNSLLFVWKGANASIDSPLMLCSHQDTVPVLDDTKNLWTHDPWSGFVDEKLGYVWGRGSSDAKSSLIAILDAVEVLLEQGFVPQRTGAAKISEFIIEHLGLENKVGMLIDEGSGIVDQMGSEFALVSTGEKGYYDLLVTVKTPGGHSSMPPDHTAIGILSDAIVTLEANPHPLSLPDNSPFLQTLMCYAENAPEIDPWLKFAIEHISEFRTAVTSALAAQPETRYLMTTSQAVDLVVGGHKVNALPEVVTATVDHRLAFDTNALALEARFVKLLKPVAAKHNLNLTLISSDPSAPPTEIPAKDARGVLEIKPFGEPLEPAPVSPGFGDKAFDTLAGTIHHVLGKGPGKVVDVLPGREDKPFAVAPILMPANTDTRHYWRLTRNIYRFGPFRSSENIHTVDERIATSSLIEAAAFYHEMIRNWSEM
ncbi:hypothetical protein HDU96_010675 [Phlyctochytrium bullatum]|nr:hypothetical protein HDU96_010675 [Phlyctochytrium bullatum]